MDRVLSDDELRAERDRLKRELAEVEGELARRERPQRVRRVLEQNGAAYDRERP